jgi:hypothetical protein
MTNAKHSAPGFKNCRRNNETHFKITTSQNAAANQFCKPGLADLAGIGEAVGREKGCQA